ncbi:MAG: anti-sigma factor family protein [Actinomycetota bacterium]
MTHPEELLSEYVDGTLADDERVVVDAHLQACAACHEDVELARSAVAALSSLEDEPVPFGVTGRVLAEAGRRFEGRRSALWGRLQWAAGAAAAAAIVAIVAISMDLGDTAGDERAGGEAGAVTDAGGAAPEATTALAPIPLERQDANYDEAGVESLASDAAQSARAPGGATGATGGDGEEVQAEFVADADPAEALGCLRAADVPVDDPKDRLIRLIEARFQRTPAYFAVFLESAGAGQEPDAVVVWVVSSETCQFVNGTQQAI